MVIGISSFSPLGQGKTATVLNESTAGAGVSERLFTLDTDSCLISLFVTSVTGSLTVKVYTQTDEGKELKIMEFPAITSASTELLIRKAAIAMGRVRVEATYTGACNYEVRVKGISLGETSVKLVGAAQWTTSQVTVGTTPVLVVAASVNDRQGVVLKNWSTAVDVYVAESAAACSTATAWPLAPRDALALDVNAGAEVWARTSAGTVDFRISQAGE